MKIDRHDLRPNGTIIPRRLRETLLRFGGRNTYDEPLYRLVRAEDRTSKSAGAWAIWKKGLSIEERGGLGITAVIQMLKEGRSAGEVNEFMAGKLAASPERIERGLKDIPVYPYSGFILEKWKPAISIGSPADWYAFQFEGQASLGPYPSQGMYELVSGPTPYLPTASELESAIRRENRALDNRPVSPRDRILQHFTEIERALEADAKRQLNMIEDRKKEDEPLMNRLSLGAGRVRQEMADRAGLKGHYGN